MPALVDNLLRQSALAPRFAGVRDHGEYPEQRGILRLVHRVPPKVSGDVFGMILYEPDFDVALALTYDLLPYYIIYARITSVYSVFI
jgi:hypothetical protein